MKLCRHLKTWSNDPFLQHIIFHYLLSILPLLLLLFVMHALFNTGREVVGYFNEMREANPVLTRWMFLFSKLGNSVFYAVYAALAFWKFKSGDRSGLQLLLCYAFFQVLIVTLLGQFLKIAVGKPRPFNDGPYVHFSLHSKNHSFISGHTAEMAGSVLPLSMLYKKAFLSFFLGCFIAAMGWSRIYLGKHHLADIWLGLLLGSMSAICTVIVWRKWSVRNEQRASSQHGVNGNQRPCRRRYYGIQ